MFGNRKIFIDPNNNKIVISISILQYIITTSYLRQYILCHLETTQGKRKTTIYSSNHETTTYIDFLEYIVTVASGFCYWKRYSGDPDDMGIIYIATHNDILTYSYSIHIPLDFLFYLILCKNNRGVHFIAHTLLLSYFEQPTTLASTFWALFYIYNYNIILFINFLL